MPTQPILVDPCPSMLLCRREEAMSPGPWPNPCLIAVHHAQKITVFAAQDYRDFLYVLVPFLTKMAVFAAQDYRDFCAVFDRFCRAKLPRFFSNIFVIKVTHSMRNLTLNECQDGYGSHIAR